MILTLLTVAPIEPDMWESVFKTYGPTGVLAGITLFLIVRYLPSVHREHRQDIKEITAGFTAALDRERESRERVATELHGAIDELKECLKPDRPQGGPS